MLGLRDGLLLVIALFLTFYLQSCLYLHPDMMYLLHVGSEVLKGGSYSTEFLETNPPFIIYIYLPVVLAAKMTGMSIVFLFRLYFVFLSGISLVACHYFISLLNLDEQSKRNLWIALLIGVLFLPVHEFGQREHFMMLATFPYLFLMMVRLSSSTVSSRGLSAGPRILLDPADKPRDDRDFSLLIGICLGLGVALKPFFLVLPIIIESYYLWQHQQLKRLFRPETISFAMSLTLYLCVAWLYYPDYFHIILPIVSHLYFGGMQSSIHHYFTNLFVNFSLAGIGFYLLLKLFRLKELNHPFYTVLFLATVAYTIAFTIPRTLFYYQILPAYACSFMLFVTLFTFIWKHINSRAALLFPLAVLFLPLYSMAYTYYKVYQFTFDPAAHALFAFFNQHPERNSYLYLSSSDEPMLFHYYANAKYVGRYPGFWWELGLEKLKKTPQINHDEEFLVNFVAKNLDEKKPAYVLMDTINPPSLALRKIAYTDQFAKFASFQSAWAYYHYYTTIGRFKIYERKF